MCFSKIDTLTSFLRTFRAPFITWARAFVPPRDICARALILARNLVTEQSARCKLMCNK